MELRTSRGTVVIFSFLVAIVAFFFTSRISPALRSLLPLSASTPATRSFNSPPKKMSTRTPVYFMSHGGPSTMFDTEHPVYPVLQRIGQEITQKVKPKAIVVFSAHWEAGPDEIQVNTALMTDLIYECVLNLLSYFRRCNDLNTKATYSNSYYGFPPEYYKVQYPNIGSPELASKVIELLQNAGIKAEGTKRGLDHGVYVGFSVAFHPEKNPLNIPIVQVSQFNSPDVDQHYRLGQAVQALRDENILVIGAGMSVHNLRDLRFAFNSTKPLPYVVSFDNALKPAMEASPSERQAKLSEVAKRPDARQAHPHFDHLMPAYITAGAAGEDKGKQLWTYHDASMGWAMYRFGEVPA
ncbi:Extradiol ring-cleavage dioxygenase, class III enzyme, subunit B [Xylaria venustula]|nr:Extradiol ring-cleavage dioxygenase, class III enzyme, subunit B [Xylaria venustula]